MLGFLCWAWSRSMTWNDGGTEWYKGRAYTLGQGSGALYLVVQDLGRNPDHIPQRGVGVPWRRTDEKPWLRPAFEKKSGRGLERYWVAHWVIVLLFLAPWCIFLILRWLRRKRIANRSSKSCGHRSA